MDYTNRMSEDLTKRFIELEKQGLKLYMLTLMFKYIRSSNWQETLNLRVEVLWSSFLSRLYNNPRTSNCWGVCFWDWGNKGQHAHCIIAINEKFRGAVKEEGFLKYWENHANEFVAREHYRGNVDPLIRSHLQRFDGSQAGILYCCKGESDGLSLNDLLVLGVAEKKKCYA